MTKIELEHSIVLEIRQCSADTLVEVLDFIRFLHVKQGAPLRHPVMTEAQHAPVNGNARRACSATAKTSLRRGALIIAARGDL